MGNEPQAKVDFVCTVERNPVSLFILRRHVVQRQCVILEEIKSVKNWK